MKKALFTVLGVGLFLAPFSFIFASEDTRLYLIQTVSDTYASGYAELAETSCTYLDTIRDSQGDMGDVIVAYGAWPNSSSYSPTNWPSNPLAVANLSSNTEGVASDVCNSAAYGFGTAWKWTDYAAVPPSDGTMYWFYWYADEDNLAIANFTPAGYVQIDWSSGVGETEPPPPEWWQVATSTSVFNLYPTPGIIVPTQSVNFNFEIFLNDIQNPPSVYAGYEVRNLTKGISYNFSQGEQEVVTSGLSEFNSDPDPTLPIGDAYQWRPYIRDGNNVRVYGYWSSFSVVEQNASSSPFTPFPDNLTATSTGEFGFVSTVVDLIASKPPFLWFMQINNAIQGATYEASSTPTVTFMASSTIFGTILPGQTSVDFLSEDVFEEFIPENIHTGFMTLQLLFFYLVAGMYIMRRTLHFFQPQQ